MARNSLSLLLIVALYLGLTLAASTDENLLRNGQVVLPQAGAGLPVAQSYIFAPLVFLYLHVQLLFQLTVLARKVRTFEVALKEEFPDTAPPNTHEKIEAKREECWDWLSAFAFVQLFQLPSGVPHASKVLAWFSIEAVPVVLLFVLDLSFVRYQSDWITWEHHTIFVIDIMFLAWFNQQVFGGGPLVLWKYLQRVVKRLRRLKTSAYERPVYAERRSWEILGRAVTAAWGVVVFGMALLLISVAHPPSFDPETVEEDRLSIWGGERQGYNFKFREAVLSGDRNLLDAGPCEWWSFACRYLNVNNNWANNTSNKSFANIDLARRKLRFAKLQGVDLQGATLGGAHLQGADFFGADLQGARLGGAHLQDVFLLAANLRRTTLEWADLQGAFLWGADLQGANLERADLRGATLGGAHLQGANLERAYLQGATLEKAGLQCVNLQEAYLQGTSLEYARLQGADLGDRNLQGKPNKSGSWYLVWAPHVSYDLPPHESRKQYLKTLVPDETAAINLAWRTEMSVEKHLQECEKKDWSRGVRLPSNPAHPDWNAWAEWTTEFACEDKYTALSSLIRWTPNDSLLSRMVDSDQSRELVRQALEDARETGEKCAGLHSIPDGQWKRRISGLHPISDDERKDFDEVGGVRYYFGR